MLQGDMCFDHDRMGLEIALDWRKGTVACPGMDFAPIAADAKREGDRIGKGCKPLGPGRSGDVSPCAFGPKEVSVSEGTETLEAFL